ncbi:MAG: hypothetical protein GY749_18295 [Desulfobacteraceae bacterium]|nr:hypothetical protein [Desulfobacteraceae bacterium]
MKSKGLKKQWWMVLFVMVLIWSSSAYAGNEEVKGIIKQFLDQYETNSTTAINWLKDATENRLNTLRKELPSAIEYLGNEISGEKSKRRIGAAQAIKEILDPSTINIGKNQHPDAFEKLDKHLFKAFNLEDKELQGKIKEIWWKIENLPKTKEPPKIPFKTSYFYLHFGGILLNPYTIKKDDDGKFMLEDGETDARFFVEAAYRNRYAWLGKEPKSDKLRWPKEVTGFKDRFEDMLNRSFRMMDYEMRLGWASADDDPSGAVVTGAGDAYMEFSIGLISSLYGLPPKDADEVNWSFNIEALTGFVTDKGAQDLHFYYGVGPVVVVGVPYHNTDKNGNKRRIEIVGGVYFGQADKPEFKDNDTREMKSKNDLPVYSLESVAIWRGDIHFPIGDNGFLTIGGRFNSNLGGEDINPWNLAIGYTISTDSIISSLLNQ